MFILTCAIVEMSTKRHNPAACPRCAYFKSNQENASEGNLTPTLHIFYFKTQKYLSGLKMCNSVSVCVRDKSDLTSKASTDKLMTARAKLIFHHQLADAGAILMPLAD